MKYELRATLIGAHGEIVREFSDAYETYAEAEQEAAKAGNYGYDVDVVSIEDEQP